jgi:hypothetical protein
MTDPFGLAHYDVQDIRDLLTDDANDIGAPAWIGDWMWMDDQYTMVADLGFVSLVKREGGEGHGENAVMVFKIQSGDTTRWFRLEGGYSSYDGFDWDGPFKETFPQVKEITVYE